MEKALFYQDIYRELVKQLYKQVGIALWAETAAAIGLTFALWGSVDNTLLISWLMFNLLVCGLGRHLLVHFYNRDQKNGNPNSNNYWLKLFAIGAFLSGISWGLAGSVLMVDNDLLRQTFTIFLLVGITAAANPFYSANRLVYTLFLLPAFVPLSIWFFLEGGVFIILGLLAWIYIIIMLVTSFYAYHLIFHSLFLRYEITNLVNNLSLAKNSLELRTNELEKSLALVRATLESTLHGILVLDEDLQIEDFNQKFLDLWKIPKTTLAEMNFKKLSEMFIDQLTNPNDFLERLPISSEAESFDELHFKDGRVFEVASNPQRIGKRSVGRVWNFRDVTVRKSLEAKLFHKANFDSLTELPNRVLALDRLTQAISYAHQAELKVAVCFLDLDRFKLINDTLGHALGDKLLIEVADRLTSCVRENDTVSRGGGDEFIIILTSLKDESDETVPIARKILTALREPFVIDGNKFSISVSIGISSYPKDALKAEQLIKNADIAMYRAKELSRNNFQFFTEAMNKKVLSRLVIENQLRSALELNEFSVVYQPIINLKTGYIVGMEALLRWIHPKLGSVSPLEFISIAEESGMIIPIGDWVLRTSCAQAKEWQTMGISHLQISVNLSGRQFKQSNFVEQVQDILTGMNLDPHLLALELTESIVMDDVSKNIEMLNKMKTMGIQIVIDDFGVGYSSLNYLKRLPVDKLKIDRSFIQDIPEHVDDTAITAAIIALASKLNLHVIAEGVENVDQLNFLIDHHCDEVQGFYFSKPLDAEACTQLLRDNRALLSKMTD